MPLRRLLAAGAAALLACAVAASLPTCKDAETTPAEPGSEPPDASTDGRGGAAPCEAPALGALAAIDAGAYRLTVADVGGRLSNGPRRPRRARRPARPRVRHALRALGPRLERPRGLRGLRARHLVPPQRPHRRRRPREQGRPRETRPLLLPGDAHAAPALHASVRGERRAPDPRPRGRPARLVGRRRVLRRMARRRVDPLRRPRAAAGADAHGRGGLPGVRGRAHLRRGKPDRPDPAEPPREDRGRRARRLGRPARRRRGLSDPRTGYPRREDKPGRGRYVRITITSAAGWASIRELEVLRGGRNITARRPVEASSFQDDERRPERAVDRDRSP